MSEEERRTALEESGLVHQRLQLVSAPLFSSAGSFFMAADKVQVKYEMLRAHQVEGMSATASAATHGYSRAAFYLAAPGCSTSDPGGGARSRSPPRSWRSWQRRPPPSRVPTWPRRWAPASGLSCTGAPWNGPGGNGEHLRGRATVLASGRSRAG